MNNIINYSIIIISFILGIQFIRQKWLFLIAGFNLSSSEDKKEMNIPVMSKIVGIFCFSVGTLLILDQFLLSNSIIVPGLIILLLIIMILLMNTIAKK